VADFDELPEYSTGSAFAGSTTADRFAPIELAKRFADMARDLRRVKSPDETMQAIVQAALRAVPGTEAGGLTVARGSQYKTLAPSSELPRQVDAIQYELRSGPCVDALASDHAFCTGDLEHDPRWPTFGKRAAIEVGVHSMLAMRLFIQDGGQTETIGSLNLYSTQYDAFSDESALLGLVFATHAAIALDGAHAADEAANLRAAQGSNREIGMAMGVLMSRHRLTQTQAFDLLRMASQHTHRKLRDIAADVVETGMLDFPTPNH